MKQISFDLMFNISFPNEAEYRIAFALVLKRHKAWI